MSPFGGLYAEAYDDLYADKDYAAECDLIEETFRRHGTGETRSIIDLGCGTGNHAIPLARRGYAVMGVDRSAEMVARAKAKAARSGVDAEWRSADVREFELDRRFDAALLMFAVLSYQTTNEDVLATLRRARALLKPDGLLVLDAWHGPGVLTDRPGARTKTVTTSSGPLERVARAEVDARRHLCRVRYELSGSDQGNARRATEIHLLRYFFPMELELFLTLAGFRTVAMAPFGALDVEPDESTWNVLAVGRAS